MLNQLGRPRFNTVAIESYLENVKTQLAAIEIQKQPVKERSQSPKGVEKQSCYKPKKKNKQRNNDSNHEQGRQNIRGQGATR